MKNQSKLPLVGAFAALLPLSFLGFLALVRLTGGYVGWVPPPPPTNYINGDPDVVLGPRYGDPWGFYVVRNGLADYSCSRGCWYGNRSTYPGYHIRLGSLDIRTRF